MASIKQENTEPKQECVDGITRQHFIAGLPKIADDIENMISQLGCGGDVTTVLNELLLRVYSLAGIAGSFGFNEMASSARKLEFQVMKVDSPLCLGVEEIRSIWSKFLLLKTKLTDACTGE